jgi:hypothetical protein
MYAIRHLRAEMDRVKKIGCMPNDARIYNKIRTQVQVRLDVA